MKTRHLIPSSIAFTAAVVCVIAVSLSPLPGYAEQGPFANFSGDWSGGGTVTLSSGSNEKIRCRATYDSQAAGNNLKLAIRCASDSYNVDFRSTYSSILERWMQIDAAPIVGGRFEQFAVV